MQQGFDGVGKVMVSCKARRRKAPCRPRRGGARRDGEAGVTLLEMMVVLVIIAIVAVMVVPNVIGRPDEARVTVARADIRTIAGALEIYRLDNRAYPTTAQGLAALVERPVAPPAPANWSAGGYLSVLPRDPWGGDYIYRAGRGGFELMSLGADGKPGGTGVDADITSANGS